MLNGETPCTEVNPVLKDSGIYKISFLTSDICYIGRSKNLYARLKSHKSKLKRNKHPNKTLQKLFNKENSFIFDVLCFCDETELELKEAYFIGLNEHNCCAKQPSSVGGKANSKQINAKRANSLKAFHAENPDHITGSNNSFYGKKHSQQTKDAISKANTGKTRSEAFRKLRSEFNPRAKIIILETGQIFKNRKQARLHFNVDTNAELPPHKNLNA